MSVDWVGLTDEQRAEGKALAFELVSKMRVFLNSVEVGLRADDVERQAESFNEAMRLVDLLWQGVQ